MTAPSKSGLIAKCRRFRPFSLNSAPLASAFWWTTSALRALRWLRRRWKSRRCRKACNSRGVNNRAAGIARARRKRLRNLVNTLAQRLRQDHLLAAILTLEANGAVRNSGASGRSVRAAHLFTPCLRCSPAQYNRAYFFRQPSFSVAVTALTAQIGRAHV